MLSEPVFTDDGIPLRYTCGPNRSLNGHFRKKGEPIASNEIVPPIDKKVEPVRSRGRPKKSDEKLGAHLRKSAE